MKRSEDETFLYEIFSNSARHEGRTRAIEAWPGIVNGNTAWTLLERERPHHDASWGPPTTEMFVGEFPELREYVMSKGGYVFSESVR